MKFVWADGIASAAPRSKVVSGTPITAGCRMIKDDHEIALMRVACAATLKVYEAVFHALQPGMTQIQVSDLIDAGYRQVGFLAARACKSANTPRSPTAPSLRK
jgi:Xaa-Pro dipeptidase